MLGITHLLCPNTIRETRGAGQVCKEARILAKHNSKTLTVEESAGYLGIGRNAAYEAIREGRFPVRVIRIGFRYLIPKAELEALSGTQVGEE